MKSEFKMQYHSQWNHLINDNLKYKKPNLVNIDMVLHKDQYGNTAPVPHDKHDPIYVFPTFMKPGKHYFIVRADPPPPKVFKSLRKEIVDKTPE